MTADVPGSHGPAGTSAWASFELSLEATFDAPRLARQALAGPASQLSGRLREDVSLLVTELVTNAVVHSGCDERTQVKVRVTERHDGVRVEVTDRGSGFAWRARSPDRDLAQGGFGLVLVESLAERWGIDGHPQETRVWFELRRGRVVAADQGGDTDHGLRRGP